MVIRTRRVLTQKVCSNQRSTYFSYYFFNSFVKSLYSDEKEYRSVVLWLEDQKIRHYKIEEREGLRDIESEKWSEAYNTYQRDLVSPVVEGSLHEQLNWLLSYAVRLEYADNGKYT